MEVSKSPGGGGQLGNDNLSEQLECSTELGVSSCRGQAEKSLGQADFQPRRGFNRSQSHNTNLVEQQKSTTDPGGGCCHTQGNDTQGQANSQLQGGCNHSQSNNTDLEEQQKNNTDLGENYCHNQDVNILRQANSQLHGGFNHSQSNNTNLGENYCHNQSINTLEQANSQLQRVFNHSQSNNTNLGVSSCHSHCGNSLGQADFQLQGVFNHSQSNNTNLGEQQKINTDLREDYCHSQGNNTLGQADPQLHEGFNHSQPDNTDLGEQQEKNTDLGVNYCHSQGNNTLGEMQVGNPPFRGDHPHQLVNIDLGAGYCHNQSDNTPGKDDQGEMEVRNTSLCGDQPRQLENNTELGVGSFCSQGNSLGDQQVNNINQAVGCCQDTNSLSESNATLGGDQLCQQGNSTNLGEGNFCSQENDTPEEDDKYSPGSGDHPCQREMEIIGDQTGIMVNSRLGAIEAEEEIVHMHSGKGMRGGTGDCLLETETKGDPEEERRQERALASAADRESRSEIGRNGLAPEECVAGIGVSTQELERGSKGGIHQEQGNDSDGGKDVLTEKTAERGQEEGINQELRASGVNCVAEECMVEENRLETGATEEKERGQNMSAAQMRDKLTQCVSTETRLQEVKIEAMQKREQNTSNSESSKEMGSDGSCQNLDQTVVQQRDTNTTGQAAEGQDASLGKANFKLILEVESSADQQLKEDCRATELDSKGPLPTATGTARQLMSTSACDSCSEHSASPRMRLDLLSPLGQDMAHPLSLTPSSPDQAGDSTSLSPSVDSRAKQGVKRVTFPSDEAIVSGAVEPKDPWRHAQNVTVEEIIAAYKMACQKLNCKPINKLLKQIQEFKELSQRLDCLDLKGEKLDYKASEALEEVFKRVQFKLVDLEATNLDEDGASALFDMIEYYESATQLNISFNKHIGTRGWQAAAHMMRKTSCLQYLDARNTPLLDHSAPFVARALRISSSLVVLHLENASLSGRPLMLLATALKMNMTLRELFLADNKLNGLQDSAQLGNLLKFNCTIQLMDLRNNHILDSGLAYISDGLKEQRQGLVTLVLWNNQLTHNGMTYMAAALPYTLSLETLNLGHNAIGNEGVHKLKDGLIANRSVLRLGLASTKLTCEGAVAVAEFIADSPRLLRLDLRENEIKTGGLMALSLALKVNHSLLRLDLDREPKKETVKSFIETQKALLTEIQNGCKRNFILAKEKEEKEQKMQQSASMPEITMMVCDNKEEPQRSQAHSKVEETADGSRNGVPQESVPSVTGNTEEMGSVSESSVTPSSVECNTQPAAQDEPKRRLTPPSVVGMPSPGKQQLQQQDPSETPSGKESVTEDDVGDGSSPATVGEQATQIVSELKSPGLESPVFVSSPIEIASRGNERLVSSPGRGHKVFLVTRVESPPENPSNQDLQWLNKALQSRKNGISKKETESSSEPLPCSASDTPTTLTVPAPASDGSSQSGSPSDLDRGTDNSGHDFETVCAKDCDHTIRGTALPNGLKVELVQRLPEPTLLTTGKDGKAVNCNIEHEFTSPKTEKELEELLLEASQETCRETS
ncbi:protein phosphatase 1 regulatory subunit 37 [Carcharodon carcharias]|uniref:protein phosphatase 1 regulatory subunit 37 n=1 Tax=Carcharodon carcharias TaxID=13397 RepID=UPI001B7EB2A5|nr:protein phosphatase 1 regulatory subunit 37 [Carcharodon carcharias]